MTTATAFLLESLHNAAFLLSLVLIYQTLNRSRVPGVTLLGKQVVCGLALGIIASIIMLTPIEYIPGITFDTRTVLISLAGLFFGPVPTFLAMAIASAVRLHLGGFATLTGIATIVCTGLLGLAWRHYRRHKLATLHWTELLLFGLVTHVLMLALMFTLPRATALSVLAGITLPVLLLFPLTTVIVGTLLAGGLRREQTERQLEEAAHRLRNFRRLLDESLDGIEVIDPASGRFIDVNATVCRELGYTREEFLQLPISTVDPQLYAASFKAVLQRLQEAGALNWEGSHRRKNGSVYPVEVKLNLVSLEADYVVAAVRNVSEHRVMEQLLREEVHMRQNLIEQSRDGIVTLDANGRVFEANLSFANMLGYSKEAVLQLGVWDWEKHMPKARVLELIAAVDARGNHFETRHTRSDGSVIDVEISTNASVIDNQKLIFCVCRDVTGRKQAEASLKLAAMVYQNSREAMMVTDHNGTIIAINPTFTRITGYTLDEVRGKNPRLLRSGQHSRQFYKAMWRELQENGHWSGEIMDKRKNGEIYAEWLSINAVYDSAGAVQCWVAQFSDITEQKDAEQLIWQQANFDSLTNLPNRRMFQDRLGQEIMKAKRSTQAIALLFLDLDNFKYINDTLGHDMGDLLLQLTAERLKQCVRESDTVARLGGDEFTLILANPGSIADVGTLAQKLLWKLSEPFLLRTEVAYVSVSIGITFYPDDATDAEGLLKNADQAMYAAKKEGRNRYHYFTVAMQEAVSNRMRMANDLREALAANQLQVVYQPIVDLSDARIRKAEALIRWQHPRDGHISPSRFIPIAEECGLIGAIGDLVFRDVLSNCARWRGLVPDLQISMNKSPAQFSLNSGAGQVAQWIGLLQAAELPGNSIVIEITEGLLLSARAGVLRQLLTLRDAGIEVALDDFGTGYSSLSYLRKFDIDYLKIDQSFISNLTPDSEDLTLCEAIITMAHRLGLKVVAEGVETAAQAALLHNSGCDYGQGYLYSAGLAPARFEELLLAAAQPTEA